MHFKKFQNFIYLSLFFILWFSFPCNASGLDASSISAISDFFSIIPDFTLQSYGFEYQYGTRNVTIYDIMTNFNGTEIDSSLNFDFTNVSETRWTPSKKFFDPDNGNEVPIENLVLVEISSELAHGYCVYDSTTGKILKTGDDRIHSQTALVGYGTDYLFNTIDDLREFADTNGTLAWFDLDNISQESLDYLNSYGDRACWGVFQDEEHDLGFFVPDVCAKNLFYVDTYSDGLRVYLTTEGYYLFQWWNNTRDVATSYYVDDERSRHNGVNYQYMFPRAGGVYSNSRWTTSHFVYTDDFDDDLYSTGDDFVSFTPTSGYDLPDTLSYDDVINNPITYTYEYNNDYSDDSVTNIYNYPMTLVNENEQDYAPDYDFPAEYEYVLTGPAINEQEGGELIVGDLTNGIPILDNLKNRFPFSIPWDIASILKGLQEPRKVPSFEWDINIPYVNYVWHIEFDLAGFNGIAKLFRGCFLVSFVIGLALFSYKHHFGN